MARDLNRVMATGRLTSDPELRVIQSGSKVAKFRLAIDDSYQDNQGTNHDQAVFIEIAVWGKSAETAATYLRKGMRIGVDGKLKYSQWTQTLPDSGEEVKRSMVSISCTEFKFMEPKKDGAASKRAEPSEAGEPVEARTPARTDDDIPF